MSAAIQNLTTGWQTFSHCTFKAEQEWESTEFFFNKSAVSAQPLASALVANQKANKAFALNESIFITGHCSASVLVMYLFSPTNSLYEEELGVIWILQIDQNPQ